MNRTGGKSNLIMISQRMKFFIESVDRGLRSRESSGVEKECGQRVL
jgi:hypothetical protein